MKLSGSATLQASPDQVWAALNDPAVLARTIPGCEQLESTGEDAYRMTVSAGVAAIRGTYLGDVRLAEKKPPTSYILHASGSGGPGTVRAECRITLSDSGDGTTKLDYDADAAVGGVVAGVGQRMLVGVAKKMAGEFFGNVNAELSGNAPAQTPVAAAPGRAPTAEPGVYAGRAAAGTTAGVAFDLMSLVTGAAIALVGVALGGWIGRRR